MWKCKDLKIMVDFTTYCNARCPQCHRNENDTLRRVDWLPKVHWTLDDFKKVFSEEILLLVRELSLTPTWGDAILNPHIVDIVKYITNANPETRIRIHTNGSMHDENWWFYFSSLSKNLYVIFDIDGIDQEMHSRYRVNTNLDKVLRHMKIFSGGIGITQTQTILFKHNEDYVDEIQKICIDHGSSQQIFTKSDRDWGNGSVQSYYDSYTDKTIILEQATVHFNNGAIPNTDLSEMPDEILCSWAEANNLVVGFDGSVHPCCYFYNNFITKGHKHWHRGGTAQEYYIEHTEELNAFKHNLLDIIQHEYFQNVINNSFTDRPASSCINYCSAKGNNPLQPRLIAKG